MKMINKCLIPDLNTDQYNFEMTVALSLKF